MKGHFGMVWLLWRQHQTQALATVGLLVVLGVLMLVQGAAANVYLGMLPVAPLLVGIFWGAPMLSREFERGTHRLAWTQSVSRRRWLLTKLGSLGLAVTVAGLVTGLMVSAWATRFHESVFSDDALFGGSGVAAGAWWLFAFLLGAAAGGVLRRLLPAMAVTIAVFMLVLFGLLQARQNYAEPVFQLSDKGPEPGAMITESTWLDPSGTPVADPPACAEADQITYTDCAEKAGYRLAFYVQPQDRYWRFQWTESGILLLGGVLLAAPVMYRVLRRPV
jgi:hypothetical protein